VNIKTSYLYSIFVSVLIMVVVLCESKVQAFDDNAHGSLSERATQVSGLDNFLKTQLGFEFPGGTNETIFNGRRVIQLIQDGAVHEDRPILWRPRHHFHNPRLAWDQAGWRPPPVFIQLGESSVIWSQDPNQVVGGKHSWHDARDTYFQALTATSDSERKRLYAETFRSLGHLIHLVQDAATPSHTRNDTHISYAGIGVPDGFHGWADGGDAEGMIVGSTPPAFDISTLNQPSPDAQAPVPISRLIDSTAGDIGLLALTPGLNLGVAEYSSANFFSDDTINSPNFLSPRSSQVEVRLEPDATVTRVRPYVYFQSGFGEQDYPLALASAMLPYVIDPLATPTENGLDTKVFRAYGTKLFPRAIGYSAGLIDYFFRGSIFVDPPLSYSGLASNPPTTITLRNVANSTSVEETSNGTLSLVLLDAGWRSNTSETFPPVVISNPVSTNISRSGQDITFPFSSLPFPSTMGSECYPQFDSGGHYLCGSAVSFHVLLVYRGPLGEETDSVIVSRCDVGFGRVLYEGREVFLSVSGNAEGGC